MHSNVYVILVNQTSTSTNRSKLFRLTKNRSINKFPHWFSSLRLSFSGRVWGSEGNYVSSLDKFPLIRGEKRWKPFDWELLLHIDRSEFTKWKEESKNIISRVQISIKPHKAFTAYECTAGFIELCIVRLIINHGKPL